MSTGRRRDPLMTTRLFSLCALVGLSLAWGCIESQPKPDVEPAEGVAGGADVGGMDPIIMPEPVTPEDCASYTRGACIASLACTLWLTEEQDVYRCAPAEGPCEVGLAQDDREGCSARPQCAFREAMCYCPCRGFGRTEVMDGEEAENCPCACGGGAPPQCFEDGVVSIG